jgi:hypothetical protein
VAQSKPKTDQQAEAEQALAASDGEVQAEQVADDLAAAERAEDRRDAQAERAASLKSYDASAELPPTQKQVRGVTAYAVSRLLEPDSNDDFGHPQHVLAGALFGIDKEYLTRDEIDARVRQFLKSPSYVHPVQGAPVEA